MSGNTIKNNNSQPGINNHIKKWQIYALIIFAFVFFDFVLLFDNFQNTLPIFGLKFEGKNVSFSGKTELEKIVREKASLNNRPLVFSHEYKSLAVFPSDVGYSVDPSFTRNKILLVGREANIFQKIFTQVKALLGFKNIKLSGKVSQSSLTLEILQIKDQVNRNPVPIHPDFVHGIGITLPAQDGVQIDTKQFAALIVKNISHPPERPIPLPVNKIASSFHQESELVSLRKQAVQLIQSSVSIASGGLIFTLTPEDLKTMLTVVERPDPNKPSHIKLLLRLDEKLLNQKLGIFAAKVETITHAEFDDHDARTAIYALFYSGRHEIKSIPTGESLRARNILGAQDKPGPKTAYLTFDDGPNAIYHPVILEILKQYNVRATFFLVGQNIPSAYEATVKTFADGHVVGNHSFTHSFLPNFSSPFVFNELEKTDNILKSINGNKPVVFFRPPYGGLNSYVMGDAHNLGLRVFLWDIDPRDWSEPSVDDLVSRVVSATHDGSNILLHSNHLATTRALPRIIENLKSQGYIFKTLDTYPSPEELW